MNLKTPFLTSAAILVALTAVSAPAQAFEVIPSGPGPVIRNPCDNIASPDPEIQFLIQQCRNADNNIGGVVAALLAFILQNVPDELPDTCSTQENVVPFVIECAAWLIGQVPPPPGSEQIVAMVNSLLAKIAALAQWGQDYVLIDLAGWYDTTSLQASNDVGALGTWVLAQTGYSAAVNAWANGVGAQAIANAGAEVAYAGTVAGVAGTNANNYSAYVICRLLSPVPCGPVPAVVSPGLPPMPTVPSVPPTPSQPPAPTVPGAPPAPQNPPL